MGTEFEGIKPGAKVIPLDETCSEWQKAKGMGQPYLMVMAVRYELSGNVCAVTANEKSRFVKVEWLSEEKLIPYEDKAWEELLQECNRFWLLMRIDQALDERDEETFRDAVKALKEIE
ncbi:IDEAL domain-containing protein [Bacillus sp. OTU530]|uniref:IDEAL domain-containing protein n=1 Tax=Bacillus sp. OTU530 TaxID=3043862 RepID=UPI00313B6AED